MKMKLSFFLCLNVFLFATTHSYLYPIPSLIYDTSGHNLRRDTPYYIIPLLHGSGGGLMTNDACPLNITQQAFEVSEGIPFTFNPVALGEELVRTSYPISMEAVVINPCSGSNLLKVSKAGKSKGFEIVTTGGELNTAESCFQIVEVEMMPELLSYQIQHCPFKCGSTMASRSVRCYNVGLSSGGDGKRYLGPSNAVYPVVFVSWFGKRTQSAKL